MSFFQAQKGWRCTKIDKYQVCLYPYEMEMVSSPILLGPERSYYIFQTKISKSEHVYNNPLLDYTHENSFDKCIRNDIKALFAKELGCQLLYLSENKDNMCNKKFNVPENRSTEIFGLFWRLLYKNMKYTCKSPCSKTTNTIRYRGAVPYPFKTLDITFDQTLDISHSKFSRDI